MLLGDFTTGFVKFVYTCSYNSKRTAPAEGKAYVFGFIGLIIVFIGLV